MTKTFLTAHWEDLVMANYSVPPEILFPYLPKGVSLDLYEDKAYVSLVGIKLLYQLTLALPRWKTTASKNLFLSITMGTQKSTIRNLKNTE